MPRPRQTKSKTDPIYYNGGIIRPTKAGSFQAEFNYKKQRPRETLPTLGQARAWIDDIVMAYETRQRPLTLLEKEQAREALQALPPGVTLPEVVKFYTDRHKAVAESILVTEAAERYLDARIRRGLRPDSIRGTRPRINKLASTYPEHLITDITTSDLAGLLDDLGVHGANYNNYRKDWRAWFEWLKKNALAADNPAERLDTHSADDTVPEFFSVKATTEFLRAIEKEEEELIPYFALSFFAGVRSAELQRMTGDLVQPDLIRVTPEKAKTRQWRHIHPCDTLRAWLEAYPPSKACLVATNFRHRAAKVRKRIKDFQWVPNGGRHSFATYDLALYQDAPRTAFIMGHKNVELLYSNYRGLTTKAEAEAYFKILPKG